MARKTLIDITATIKIRTEKAYLIVTEDKKEAWVPRSQIEDNRDGTFTMPEWLAIEKELV